VTHRGCLLARDRLGPELSWWCYEESQQTETQRPVSWWLYEDFGYKHIPGMLAWRVSQLFRRGLWPTPVCPPVDPTNDRKAAAVACYPSQLSALDDDWQIGPKLAAPAPEQFWRIAPPPAGWERLADE